MDRIFLDLHPSLTKYSYIPVGKSAINYEEKEVYPKLDQALSEREKKHIIAKINEII